MSVRPGEGLGMRIEITTGHGLPVLWIVTAGPPSRLFLSASADIWYPLEVVLRSALAFLILAYSVVVQDVQPVPLLSIAFEGNRSISSTRLRSLLRFLHEGSAYKPEVVQIELQSIERFYKDEGFLRAALGRPLVEYPELPGKGKVAAVRIPVFEGPRYTLANLQIRNVTAVSPETLLQMSPVKVGNPYSRRKLSEWTQKVKEAYHALGYLRADVRLHELVDDLKYVVDCTLECSEGAVYRVQQIDVVGLDASAKSDFMRRILVGIDMPYNPEMLTLSLQLLNSMGIYRPMGLGSVKVTIDDDSRTVRLEFHPIPLRRQGTSLED